jgi:hypothetical protein
MSFQAGSPINPMPVGGAFVASFITVNGRPLRDHYMKTSQIPAKLEQLPMNVAPQLLNEAKEFSQKIVPVDTGYLRGTIDWEQISRYIFRFFASAKYARHVEEGTYRMRGRPYMAPAMMRLKEKAPQVIINQVRSYFV